MADDPVLLKLVAGRAQAGRRMPYLATALYAIRPVEANDIDTAAVDKSWRMYWNRAFISGLSTEEIATVWLHEVGHLLRDHNRRAQSSMVPAMSRRDWNKAADAPINADLREAGVLVFNWMVFPETIDPDATSADTTEYLYDKLTGGNGQDDSGKPDPEQESPQDKAKGDNAAGAESPPPEEKPDSDEDPSGEKEDGSTKKPDEEPADAEDPTGSPSADSDEGDDTEPGEGDQPADGQGEGEGEGDSGQPAEGEGEGDSDGQGDQPGDGHTDCGSGSGGPRRDWEEAHDPDDGSVDEGRAQRIRNQVAHDTIEYASSGRGVVPGGMERWAKNFLKPQVDWKRELRAVMRRVASSVMGRTDYTYQRPRRNAAVPGVIFPGMVDRPPPVVRVIVDTSGSMDPKQLEQCVAEIGEIVKRLSRGGGSVDVIACDAAVAMTKTIRKPANIDLKGGGGTDMRVGIVAAAEAKPKANLIITLTDGFTPWPLLPPVENKDAKYLVVIVPPVRKYRKSVAKVPPTWMHTIVMDAAA